LQGGEAHGTGGLLTADFLEALGATKTDAEAGRTWFSDTAEVIGTPPQTTGGGGGGGIGGALGVNLNTILKALYPKADGGAPTALQSVSGKISELFGESKTPLAGLGDIFRDINTGGAGMLDRLAAGREPDPRGLRTLSGKFVAVDAAWGRSEAQLTLNEQRLKGVRDAADAAGAGAAGALSALDGILTTNLGELAAQGEALSGLLGDMRGILERIAALEPGDTAGAEALKAELADTTARADEAAAMTLEKVEEVEEDSAEQLEEIIREVAEITAGTRPGFASFDFAGSGVEGTPSAELQKLLGDDVDILLTEAQQRFRLDALFNTTHHGDRVVIDVATLFETLRAGSRTDGFDAAAALAEVLSWTYAHEIAHTLGLPDLYDFETGKALPGAGLMGERNDFTLTDALKGVIAFASDNPEATRAADLSAIYEMLRTARDANVLGDDDEGGRDYLFAPPVGARPLLDTGWQILGDVQTSDGNGLQFVEAGVSRTSAYRALLVPANASTLSFTLRTTLPVTDFAPPDAFEMALLDANGAALTRIAGLAGTDAALNLQPDGRLRLAPGVTAGPVTIDDAGRATRLITVDLAAIGDPARLALSLDLVGFGEQLSSVQFTELKFDVPSTLNNTPPVLTDGTTLTLTEDTSTLVDLRGLVSDAEGGPLTYEIAVPPLHGTLVAVEPGVWRYTPDAEFSGTDGLRFTASDGVFRPQPVGLTLVVEPVNDAPVLTGEASVTLDANTSALVDLRGLVSDAEGDPLTFEITLQPEQGTLVAVEPGVWRYTPNADFAGNDQLRFTASDGTSRPDPVTLDLIVRPVTVEPVNTAPVLTSGASVTLDEDTSALVDLRGLATDAEGDPLVYEITAEPQHGTLVAVEPGVWRYTPGPDFSGRDSLRFTASDGDLRALPVELALIVTPVNDAPVLAATGSATVREGDRLVLQLTAVDPERDPITWSIESGAPGATIDSDGLLRWTAAVDGPVDRIFRILAEDGQGGTARQTLTVRVENAAPRLTLDAPGINVVETPLVVSIAALDPGGDAVGPFSIDWGDGTQEQLAPGTTTASHSYDRLGQFSVSLRATDKDGAEAITRKLVEVVSPGLRVTQVTSGDWGVNVRFNVPVDTGLPNPYRLASRAGEPVDVMLLDAKGKPVRGSLVPDADGQGFTFLVSADALPPGEYRLRLVSDDLGWRSRWDLLEAGPQGYEERVITIQDAPVRLALQDAVQTPGEALGNRGDGLAIGMNQSGGLRSLRVQVSWDADMMSVTGLLSSLPGVTVTRTDPGLFPGQATYRIAFATPPAAGMLELGRLMGQMHADAAYGSSGTPLRVQVIEINGVAQGVQPFGAADGNIVSAGRLAAVGSVAFSSATAAPEARGLTLVARRGDADGDGVTTQSDLARFAEIPRTALIGLDAWSFIDPNLLRPLPPDPAPPVGGEAGGGARRIGASAEGFGQAAFRGSAVIGGLGARSLIDAAQPIEDSGRSDRLLYLHYSTPVPLCLVPEGAADDRTTLTQAARAGLCFDGLPADLSDPDQLWRLSGIAAVSPAEAGESASAEDGPVCVDGALPDGAEEGDIFRMTPLPKGIEVEAAAAGNLPMQHRMCFEPVEADAFDSPEDAATGARENDGAALQFAPETGPSMSPFTALALLSAAVPARAADRRGGAGSKGARRAILLSDMTESGQDF